MEDGSVERKGPHLETVRALHQTVVALRRALEESKEEIINLKASLAREDENLSKKIKPKIRKIITPKHRFHKKFKRIKTKLESKILIKSDLLSRKKLSTSFESLLVFKSSLGARTLSKTNSQSDLKMSEQPTKPGLEKGDSDPDQEVDDIELIFTTDDTKDSDFKEELVSIDAADSTTESANLLQCPDGDQNAESDRELDDDVFNDNENLENLRLFQRDNSQLCNSKSDNSINHEEKSLKSCYSYQDSSFENKSLEKDESFDRFEEKIRIVETDISKCGIQDVEYSANRRNTCPNPLQYRPLIHRKSRPILAHSNAIRKDSGAQTDISALPKSSWVSESNLAHKVRLGDNFPTLPSKFPIPGPKLRLSEKTVEARRVLLSDIGFTSMVPELSRSADHLCPGNAKPPSVATTYGQFLRANDMTSPAYTSQKFIWTTTATPSDYSYSNPSRYNSTYPLTSPPITSRRCSAPVSPSRRPLFKNQSSKVRFANGSLPELRTDWNITMDSGDSTDSLVEEAENFLRRSIDCILSTSGSKKIGTRRASAPEPTNDNAPPQGWQPFLPRHAHDLKLDHWVKVITSEGRVRGGRVRYVGPVGGKDSWVGVQLSTPDGTSDGMFGTRRYFNCEALHGIFVPFQKIIMGWRP